MDNLHVQIKLFATLAAFTPPEAHRFALKAGATVGDLVHRLQIPVEQAKLIFINGVHGRMDSPLNDGDRVGIFPPVGGG